MTITITWQMVAWFIAVAGAWTGFLLGAIKYLLNRQITGLETRLADAETVAKEAAGAVVKHQETVAEKISALRLEFRDRSPCNNHARMETADARLFEKFDQLHGDIRELAGGVRRLTKSVDMVQQHLMNGENR